MKSCQIINDHNSNIVFCDIILQATGHRFSIAKQLCETCNYRRLGKELTIRSLEALLAKEDCSAQDALETFTNTNTDLPEAQAQQFKNAFIKEQTKTVSDDIKYITEYILRTDKTKAKEMLIRLAKNGKNVEYMLMISIF